VVTGIAIWLLLLSIEIQNSRVEQLVNEFGGDYSLMAEHLKIMNKRMVLLNPVPKAHNIC
jgi:diacylglycerol kinase